MIRLRAGLPLRHRSAAFNESLSPVPCTAVSFSKSPGLNPTFHHPTYIDFQLRFYLQSGAKEPVFPVTSNRRARSNRGVPFHAPRFNFRA
jgi:hypothetical protein